MTSPPPRRRPTAKPPRASRPPRSGANRNASGGLWVLVGLLYAAAGVILTALASPWVWGLAALGTLLQTVVLAGPQALQRFRWLTANLLVLAGIVGSGALAAALAIALNHLGTDNIDDITLVSGATEVILYSLLAVVLAGLCSMATAALGDRLLRRHPGRKASLFLLITCLGALAVGGGLGLAVAQGG